MNLGMASRCFIISLVLLSLCTNLSTSDSGDVFLSIDCGSSTPYTDDHSITWVGDDEYVKSGESRSFKPLNPISPVGTTLRVFPTGNKNCYNIDSVKRGRVLVRASFYYGNYDGKNMPPTFSLSFDGNVWATVVTSSTEWYDYEVIYVMKRDSISVCLARTQPDQFPFISALAIGSLEPDMNKEVSDDYPLFTMKRVAFGSKTVIRPTDDSTLPPLINAMEIFQIAKDELTDGTNKKDVEGLASLVESFSVLQNWSGDPCLPAPYTWDWIECNSDPIPRVTALLLNGHNLSGLLPDFSSMDALQTINLNNNSLQGPIPDFLGTLPNLKILNLANNQFNGSIPGSLALKQLSGLSLTVSGNPELLPQGAAPFTPRNSSIKKKKNILKLLFITMIASMIML